MVFVLYLIAVICFIGAGMFSLNLFLPSMTVQQQTVYYLGLGFTTLTFVAAVGFAGALRELDDIHKALRAAAGAAGASDAFREWEKSKRR